MKLPRSLKGRTKAQFKYIKLQFAMLERWCAVPKHLRALWYDRADAESDARYWELMGP